MPTEWQKRYQQLKERDLVRMQFDIPKKLQYEMRLAAAQDGVKLQQVYLQAIEDYLRDRKIQRSADPKRNADLKLDLSGLE